MQLTKKYITELSYCIIGCAIEVHKELGPGLLESIYQSCLLYELRDEGLSAQSEVEIPVYYKGEELNQKLRLDILVEDLIIIEVKAVEVIHPVYKAQLLSYLKLTNKPKGHLINFHTHNISKEIISYVGTAFELLP